MNFLYDLVNKTSATSDVCTEKTDEKSDNCPDKICGNERSTIDTSPMNEDKIIFSDLPPNIYEELNKLNVLNGYISMTPLLREKILRQPSFYTNYNNGMAMELDGRFEYRKEIDTLLKQLYRNVKLQEIADNLSEESDLFINDYQQRINDILLVVDALKRSIDGMEDFVLIIYSLRCRCKI